MRVAGPLPRGGAGQRAQRLLADVVLRGERVGVDAVERADVDDRAAAGVAHDREAAQHRPVRGLERHRRPCSICASVECSSRTIDPPPHALFTSTSTRPQVSIVASTIDSTEVRSVTSATTTAFRSRSPSPVLGRRPSRSVPRGMSMTDPEPSAANRRDDAPADPRPRTCDTATRPAGVLSWSCSLGPGGRGARPYRRGAAGGAACPAAGVAVTRGLWSAALIANNLGDINQLIAALCSTGRVARSVRRHDVPPQARGLACLSQGSAGPRPVVRMVSRRSSAVCGCLGPASEGSIAQIVTRSMTRVCG